MADWLTVLCAVGTVFFLTESEKGHLVRRFLFRWEYFERMFGCPFCTGFWVGAIIWPLDHSMSAHHLVEVVKYIIHWWMYGVGVGIISLGLLKFIDMAEAIVYGVSLAQSLIPANEPLIPANEPTKITTTNIKPPLPSWYDDLVEIHGEDEIRRRIDVYFSHKP